MANWSNPEWRYCVGARRDGMGARWQALIDRLPFSERSFADYFNINLESDQWLDTNEAASVINPLVSEARRTIYCDDAALVRWALDMLNFIRAYHGAEPISDTSWVDIHSPDMKKYISKDSALFYRHGRQLEKRWNEIRGMCVELDICAEIPFLQAGPFKALTLSPEQFDQALAPIAATLHKQGVPLKHVERVIKGLRDTYLDIINVSPKQSREEKDFVKKWSEVQRWCHDEDRADLTECIATDAEAALKLASDDFNRGLSLAQRTFATAGFTNPLLNKALSALRPAYKAASSQAQAMQL